MSTLTYRRSKNEVVVQSKAIRRLEPCKQFYEDSHNTEHDEDVTADNDPWPCLIRGEIPQRCTDSRVVVAGGHLWRQRNVISEVEVQQIEWEKRLSSGPCIYVGYSNRDNMLNSRCPATQTKSSNRRTV